MYLNTEQAILERLAEHRGGVSIRGLALPLRMSSAYVAIIGRSLERRGMTSLHGPVIAITAAGRRALARSQGDDQPHARRGRPRIRAGPRSSGGPRTRAEAPRPAPRAKAPVRPRARRTRPATPTPTRRVPQPPRTILDDLRSFWKVLTTRAAVGERK